MLVNHSLLKFLQSNMISKTNVSHYWRTLEQSLFLKTTAVRQCPSRLMQWWAQLIMLSITWTWQVIRHSVSSKFSVLECISLQNVSEHTAFQIDPYKEITSQHIKSMCWPRNVAMNVTLLKNISTASTQQTSDHISMYLLNGIPNWT
jgi:hypothetical protein